MQDPKYIHFYVNNSTKKVEFEVKRWNNKRMAKIEVNKSRNWTEQMAKSNGKQITKVDVNKLKKLEANKWLSG